jgi:hypothetical protein
VKSARFLFLAFPAIMVLILATSCSKLEKALYIEIRPTKIVLHNNSLDSLYAAVSESRSSIYSNWEPCTNPLRCSDYVIAPGRSLNIPYLQIYRWLPGTKVTVHWYSLIPLTGPHGDYQIVGLSKKVVPTPRKSLLGS